MNARTARQVLRGYQPSGEDDQEREVREALKIAARTPELQAEFQNQVAFDRELAAALDDDLPPELTMELEAAALKLEVGRPRRFSFRDPAMLTVGFAFLALVVLMVWIIMGRLGSFAGMQEAVDMVQDRDNDRAESFQPIETNAGSLADWFVMQSFDGFVVPPGLESAPVLGVRIARHDEVPVAVAAVAKPKSLFFVFEVAPFGISIPKGEWKIVPYGTANKNALAITQIGNMAFVYAPREGGKAQVEKFVNALH